MKNLLKKYWWCIIVIILLLPLFLNWVVTRDNFYNYKVAGEPKDWLSFWVIYFSALMSFAMVIITWYTLKQNKEQLDEIKRERKESQRARLVFDIIISQKAYFLRIRNIGKENAFNVSICVNEDFIQNLEDNDRVFFEVIKQTFYVPTDIPKYFFIGPCEDVITRWKGKNIPLSLTGTYSDNYKIQENIDMNQFIDQQHIIVEDELTTAFKYFKEGVITQNDSYFTIQKSMDIIAKNIEKYMNHASEEEADNENNN